MGGAALKVLVGGFLVWLSSQAGTLATEILAKVRVSVQASEMMTVDGYLTVSAIEERRTRFPRDQAEFEKRVRDQLSARGRDPTLDRWGEPYVYEPRSATSYRLTSKGPDRRLGTDDDIVVEREGDRVTINRDPAKIAEEAIERKKKFDAEAVARLREILEKAAIAPLPSSAPTTRDDDPKIREELKALARDLGKMLG